MTRLVLAGTAMLLAGCRAPLPAAAPAVVRVAGTRVVELLAREYAHTLTGITVQTMPMGSPISAVEVVERGDADLGVVFADAAYAAYSNPTGENRGLRAIATLQVAPLVLLVGSAAGIHSVHDLRGHVVRLTSLAPTDPRFADGWPVPPGLVQAASPTPMRVTSISQLLLLAYGINPTELRWRQILPQADALNALGAGTLDAMFMTVFDSDVLSGIPEGVKMIPFEGPPVDRLRNEYSFMRPVTIPAGTYRGQAEAVHTVGIDLVLICRSDLPESLVYELTRANLMALPRVWAAAGTQHPPPDLERALATPIPLHDGAARFYREWELFR